MSKICKIHEFFFWFVLFVFKGVKFFHFATECFPLDRLDLWSRDGVSRICCVSISYKAFMLMLNFLFSK